MTVLCLWTVASATSTKQRRLLIEEGEAKHTLKQAATQLNVQILFATDIPTMEQTNAIRGMYSAQEALDLLLKGTRLKAVPISDGTAFGIFHRSEVRGRPVYHDKLDTEKKNTRTKMNSTNKRQRRMRGLLGGLIALGAGGVSTTYAQNSEEEEEVFTLSPFTVSAGEDKGYRATSTLAGSRIRSKIKDLGASIAVITEDFLDDTGATDGESLLSYVGNVEVGGTQGNFSDVNLNNNSTNDSRNNPQSGQRVRGLVSATLTRDYFTTNIPFDRYNTDRVTVNRGPNSVLFGLGSPGGVVNNGTSKAIIGSDRNKVTARIDHRGGHRLTFDFNRTLIEDRLAIRASLLDEEIKFKQKPAFEEDQRAYFAWTAVLSKGEKSNIFGKTTFKGSIETGEIVRNPPDVVPPTDGFSSWFEGIGTQDELNRILSVQGVDFSNIGNNTVTEAQVRAAVTGGFATLPEGVTLDEFADAEGNFVPQSTRNRITGEGGFTNSFTPYFLFPAINYNDVNGVGGPGWNSPELAGIQGIMGRWRPNGFSTQDIRFSSPATGGVGFRASSLQDRNVFDYHNNLFQGTTNNVETDFDLYQFVLEQELFNGRAGFEIAFDSQERQQDRFNAFSSGNSKQISIDITQQHSPADSDFDGVADRLANENLGRPIVRWNDNTRTQEWREQDTIRATVFGTLDFKDFIGSDRWAGILGKHTVTGLYEERTNDFRNRQTRGSWWADTGKWPGSGDISNGLSDNFRRIVKSQVYLGPDTRGLSGADQVRLDGPITVPFPAIGDEFGIWYFDNNRNIDTDIQNTWRIIENVQSANITQTVLESQAFNLQSRFFGGNLIASWARRTDEQSAFQRIQETQNYGDPSDPGVIPERLDLPGINEIDGSFNEALIFLEDDPASVDEDSTTTWSAVGTYPENLLGELPFGMDISAHYYEAESFQPAGISNNVLNEPLANPFGKTREHGITVELFESRLSIRYNQFVTRNANARTNLGGQVDDVVGRVGFYLRRIADAEDSGLDLFPSAEDALLTTTTIPDNRQRLTGTDADLIGVNSYDEYYARLIEILPPRVQDIYNYRVSTQEGGSKIVESNPIRGLSSTMDFVSEGKEIEIVGSLTDNWTLSLNVAQQQTVTSNTGPTAIPLAQEINQRIIDLGLFDIRDSPFQVETGAIGATRYASVLRELNIQQARDNTVSQEQREWRVNLVSRYDFTDGRFKGLSIGGGLRYQDEIAIGYPNRLDEFGSAVPDIANPWLGTDELNGDMFFRYGRKLNDGKIDWSIQFNARNLYRQNGDDDIPVTANPDGSIAVIRIPNSRQFFLTNTFRF